MLAWQGCKPLSDAAECVALTWRLDAITAQLSLLHCIEQAAAGKLGSFSSIHLFAACVKPIAAAKAWSSQSAAPKEALYQYLSNELFQLVLASLEIGHQQL